MVPANSFLVTEISKKKHVSLERILCIYYPFRFRKKNAGVRVLIDSSSEVNATILVYISKFGFKVYFIDVGAIKYNIVITGPVNHELHVILPRDLIRNLSTSSFNLHCFRYELLFTISSPLYRLGHQLTLALPGAEVLRVICKLNKQFAWIVSS